ncbi:NTP transferase domain-containing protein [Nocardia yamanashiensis]|uniref:nucleotidyltransferase family protein n=1 Tax=Nocardia yamanashiensis TaxID=209247 RepID=UPI001E5A56F3|nr:NTP transferase domain-containing protein [Nocardia yamanashiensis]UGT39327.1 NTP transferase domain-containing protein [Nocardia yamanashiensis]
MTPLRCDGIVLAAGAGTRYGMPKVLAENGAWVESAVRALRDGGCERVFVVLGATGPAQPESDDPADLDADPNHPSRWLVSRTPRIALPDGAHPVWAADWATGLSASMRAGLAAVANADAAATATDAPSRAATPTTTAVSGPNQSIATRITKAGNTAPRNTASGNTPTETSGPAGSALPDTSDSAASTAATGGGVAEFVAIMPVDTPDVGADVVARVIAAARGSASGLARAVFGAVPGHPVVLGREHWAGVSAAAQGNSGAGSYLRERADMVCVTCDDLATGMDQDYPRSGAR